MSTEITRDSVRFPYCITTALEPQKLTTACTNDVYIIIYKTRVPRLYM